MIQVPEGQEWIIEMINNILIEVLYSAREQISKNTKCSYSLEQVKTILKLIKPILERSKVEEVRTLMHLMIEEITIDRKTRSVDTISQVQQTTNRIFMFTGGCFERGILFF